MGEIIFFSASGATHVLLLREPLAGIELESVGWEGGICSHQATLCSECRYRQCKWLQC